MRDPFRELLARLEVGAVVLTDDDRRRFAPAVWGALLSAGVLAPTTAADTLPCPVCDHGHDAEVVRIGGRWRVRCTTFGARPIGEERLRRWEVAPTALGRAVSGRPPVERLRHQVWELGGVRVGEADRPGWLVTGWRGKVRLGERVPELAQPNAVAFVPAAVPPPAVWGDVRPLAVPLATVLTLSADGLTLNPTALAAHLPVDPPTAVLGAPLPADPLPPFLSAADLARRLGRPPGGVETFLRRYRDAHPDSAVEVPGPRVREPRVLYRTADVWGPLTEWAAGTRPRR